MRLHTDRRPIKSIDLLPLINVVFLLILFVLVAGRPTTHHPQGVAVATSRIENPHRPAAWVVSLTEKNEFFLHIGGARQGPKTVSEIAEFLHAKKMPAEIDLPIELIADRAAYAEKMLDFRAALAKVGIGEIRLKTEFVGGAQ